MNQIQINGRTATHYCNQCGALWIDFHTHWSLASLHCGKCCDNVPMGEQIVLLAQPTTPPAVEGDGWDAQAYATMRDNLEAWKQRALTAEADADRLCAEFNAENGPTHMGEPALPDVPFGMDWNTGKLHTPPGEAVSGDAVGAFAIEVEKLLCAALGREWRPSGFSIESLIEALAKREGFALDVFRIAGGDVECCPNPTQEEALACLIDLRDCYDEMLASVPVTSPAVEVTDAMVERAQIAYYEHDDSGSDQYAMRAALTAALTASRKGG